MTFPPTTEQSAIINAVKSTDTSIIVRALAGTGKTTTLKMVAPHFRGSVLALAFNKKNALDLEKALPPSVVSATLNSIGHRALCGGLGRRVMLDGNKIGKLITEYSKELGYQERLDDDEWASVRTLVIKARIAGLIPTGFQQTMRALVPDLESSWAEIAAANDIVITDRIYRAARTVLTRSIKKGLGGEIDYDDQIYLSSLFVGIYPRFDNVLVDESQDLSPLNHLQLRKLKARRYFIVGDDRQAIYAFRGADASSMVSLRGLSDEWIELPLATTWRCPRSVVARQRDHVPSYTAAPEAPEGEVISLQNVLCNACEGTGVGPDSDTCPKCEGGRFLTEWSWDMVPKDGDIAVICRNNAPLVSLAFKFLSRRISFQMLGRDFGKGLKRLLNKICGDDPALSVTEVAAKVLAWKRREMDLAEVNDKPEKADKICDQADSLLILCEGCDFLSCVLDTIDEMFKDTKSRVTLSSGHKAKGLEWHTVIHLDPWRIPSKYARKAAEDGNMTQLEQEYNLRYVIETRAKHRLILADEKDFT